MAKKVAAALDPMQLLTIITLVTTFAGQVAVNVIGKTGTALAAGIVKSVQAALPGVEQLTGRDLLHDDAFNEAMQALARAFVAAPKRKK